MSPEIVMKQQKHWPVLIAVLALLLALTFPGHAQRPDILETMEPVLSMAPANDQGRHIRIFADSWEELNLLTGQRKKHDCPGIGEFTKLNQPLLTSKDFFLISIMGGMVYQVNDSVITRIDKSYDHKMQSSSIIFNRNDTIMRHGGYGFWSSRNFITYFDFRTHAWELYPFDPTSEIPPGLSGHYYHHSGDSLLVFGGWQTNPANPLNQLHNEEAWLFDFRKHSWIFLGRTSPIKDSGNMNHAPVLTATPSLLLTETGTAFQLKENLTSQIILPQSIAYRIVEWYIHPFRFRDKIYFYRHIVNSPEKVEFCSMPASLLKFNPDEASTWIKEAPSPFSPMWYVLPLIVIGAAALWLRRKTIQENAQSNINRENNPFGLQTQEKKLLELFLARYPESLTVLQLDELLETSTKSRDVQNQRRSQVMRSINLKCSSLLKVDAPVILSRRSEQDGRMMEYYISPDHYEGLVKISGN